MGGDHAPDEVIKGASLAVRPGLAPVLVGPAQDLGPRCAAAGLHDVRIVDAPETIGMGEDPARAVKNKPGSSLVVGACLVADGEAAAFVSAGNSGAFMAAALLNIGRNPRILRPAIGVSIPAPDGPVLLVDAGANVDCRPEHLLQFALMGDAYYRSLYAVEKPRVGLLSVGEESGKGDELTKSAYGLLQGTGLNFIGNVEGHHVLARRADVVVCDGFAGNVLLKGMEGAVATALARVRDSLAAAGLGEDVIGRLREVERSMDPEEYGGALLLGIEGVCIVGHGRSTAVAVQSAILMAAKMVEADVVGAISRELEEHG